MLCQRACLRECFVLCEESKTDAPGPARAHRSSLIETWVLSFISCMYKVALLPPFLQSFGGKIVA